MKTLEQIAIECGAVHYSPPPMRAVKGVSFNFEQLQSFVDAVNAERGEQIGYLDIIPGTGITVDLKLENCDYFEQGQPVYTAPQPPVAPDQSAYEGAREDLLIWKKRALEAEEKVRVYDKRIVGLGVLSMETASDKSKYIKRLEDALQKIITAQDSWDSKIILSTVGMADVAREAIASKGE